MCVSLMCLFAITKPAISRYTVAFSDQQFSILYWFAKPLLYINSMINPFIYGTFNARYRAALRSVLTCKIKE